MRGGCRAARRRPRRRRASLRGTHSGGDGRALGDGEQQIGDESKRGNQDGAAENLVEALKRDALDDRPAQAAEVHVRRDRDCCDHLQCGRTQTSDEEWKAERNLHLPENLPFGHAHGACRIDDATIDRFQPGIGTSEQRRDREEDESDDRGFGNTQYPEQQHEQHHEPERRHGPCGT
ncbi:hypothetical protein DC31_04270 [Microbacterium sp. CH12i]|nr:hypothetical protein DC31_04270 [Microbacterium sp. CH12i]